MKIKYLLFLVLIIILPQSVYPQITWEPLFPTDSDSIVVFFDATKGSKGLQGYTGDVYAHTGVITDKSTSGTDWKYVKTNWGQNTPDTKLERIGTDLYKYVIKPSSRVFYTVPQNEKILQVAFVFRSSSSPYQEGKGEGNTDIYLPVYEAGLNLSIISPQQDFIFSQLNDTIKISAVGLNAEKMYLYSDNNLIYQVSNDTINYNIIINNHGKRKIKIVAEGLNQTKIDSFSYMVNYPVTIEATPLGTLNGINYTSNSSVVLSLYAPGKDFVYVIGDFTDWEVDTAYYMKRTPDQQRYWLEIENLSTSTEYAYQYFIDGEIRIVDPYAEKILDPWNDQHITSATYPNLKPYPTGKTENIVGVLQTGQTPYSWQVQDFQRPKKTDLVIYEILLRDFVSTHNYKTLKDTLNYLKNLGVNAIELMPVNEFEGNESWGYNPMMYFAPDKYYGTKNDLKEFIDAAHQKGIAVFMDIVLNHAYGLNPMVRMYFENGKPSADNPWFNQQSNFQNPDAQWGYDFNHESIPTQYFVDRLLKYWLTEYKFDGFRFDFTKGIGNNIKTSSDPWGSIYDADRIRLLKRMVDQVWLYDSTAVMIFEHLAENSEEKVLAEHGILLWGNMNYNYNEASMGWNNNSNLSGASYKARGWSKPHLITYMESHDEERLMFKNISYGNVSGNYNIKDTSQALNRMKLVSAFFFTIPGPKMIWQFGELGYDYSINFGGRLGNKPLRWDYFDQPRRKKLYKVIQALTKLKVEYDAFETSDYTLSVNGALKSIKINDSSMKVNIIGNFDVIAKDINPLFQETGTWYDYFGATSMNVTDTQAMITLEPGEFHIYTDVQLPAPEPDIITEINKDETLTIENFELMQNYPNPFNPSTVITYTLAEPSKVTLKIFNLLGQEIKILVNEESAKGVYSVRWNGDNNANNEVSSGVYFYRIEVEGQKSKFIDTKKMILIR